MTAPPLRAQKLVRRFGGVAVLAGVDLVVEAGELVVLLGANGAGKTTLLRVLATLLRPSDGRLELFGLDAGLRAPATLRRVGYVGHESACYPDLTGAENLAFYAGLYDVPDAATRVAELLTWAGLDGAARRPVRVYSRGMQQRLALARAMLHAPDLLILDEPFSGLDPAAQTALDDRLLALRTSGHAIVLSTHDVARAAPLATRTVVLQGGRIVWNGAGAADPVVLARTYDDLTRGRA